MDGRHLYDQAINNPIKKYEKFREIATGQDDYTTGCLLHYSQFKNNYRLIAVDLSKKKALDSDTRAIQQIVFTGDVKGESRINIIFLKSLKKQS